jgi:choline-sulfatase
MRTLVFFLVICLGCGLTSCGHEEPARQNVVLIVIDTLRADHLPFYGHPRDTAPYLSTLAEGGAVFEHAYSVSSWTAPATASILTSLHPVQHGVLSGVVAVQERQRTDPTVQLCRIPDEVQTIAEAFRAADYATCAVADNPNVTRAMGFDQGFDSFWTSTNEGAEVVNTRVREWQTARGDDRPYFLYLHYMDPHQPYEQHAPWFEPKSGELAVALEAYDSEISFVDSKIRELADLLGWQKNTTVIMTADHGEEFLEHGGSGHGRTLYGEVVDVPLLIWSPELGITGRRIAGPASVLDITPTLRAAGRLSPAASDQGLDLLPAARGEMDLPADRLILADLRCPPWYDDLVLKSAIRAGKKLIMTLPDHVELYDLESDPREQSSLASQQPGLTAKLAADLAEYEQSCPKHARVSVVDTLDAETQRKLKSLGYVH